MCEAKQCVGKVTTCSGRKHYELGCFIIVFSPHLSAFPLTLRTNTAVREGNIGLFTIRFRLCKYSNRWIKDLFNTLFNKAIRDGKYLARHIPVLGNVHPIKIENFDMFSWRHFSSCYIINWYGYPRGSHEKYLKEIVSPVFWDTPLNCYMLNVAHVTNVVKWWVGRGCMTAIFF